MRTLTTMLLSAIFFLCACGGGNNKTNVVAFAQAGEGTVCISGQGSSDNADCSGRFGFTVDQNGTWTAGPSFQQQVSVHGQITMDELNALQAAAHTYLDSVTGTTFCHGSGTLPAFMKGFSITPIGQQAVSVSSDAPDPITCLQGDPAATAAFTAQLDQLRQKYYPVPFPGE